MTKPSNKVNIIIPERSINCCSHPELHIDFFFIIYESKGRITSASFNIDDIDKHNMYAFNDRGESGIHIDSKFVNALVPELSFKILNLNPNTFISNVMEIINGKWRGAEEEKRRNAGWQTNTVKWQQVLNKIAEMEKVEVIYNYYASIAMGRNIRI